LPSPPPRPSLFPYTTLFRSIDLTSDNRNRTVAEIRNILTKQNANLAEAGAVSWQFHKKGLLVVEQDNADEEKLMTIVLDAGAEEDRKSTRLNSSHLVISYAV